MKVDIKVSRIGSGVRAGFWQWRMRRSHRIKGQGKWLGRSAMVFTDTHDANTSARRMVSLMEEAGAQVNFEPALYDFPNTGQTRRRKKTERADRIGAGPGGAFIAMARYGVFVVRGQRNGKPV